MKCPTCDQERPKRSELQLREEIKELKLRNHVDRTRADSYRAVLRDQFAMAALTGLLSSGEHSRMSNVDEFAYCLADAMMKTRQREAAE